MGADSVFSDLCVLKSKILEVFQDLMNFDEFSDIHQNRLYEAFNFLEESLCILSDISTQIKLDLAEKDTCKSEKANEPETQHEETETANEFVAKKRKICAEGEQVQSKGSVQDSSPPAKRGRRSPRKSTAINTAHLSEQKQDNEVGNVANVQKVQVEKDEETSAKRPKDKSKPDDTSGVQDRDKTVVVDVTSTREEPDRKENVVLNVEIPAELTRKKKKGRGRPRKDLLKNEILFKVNEEVECKDCRRILCSPTEFVDHMCRTEAESEAPYQCDKCDIMFKTKMVILNHMSNHKDKATATCRTCTKTFQYASLLKAHSHGEEGHFRCKKCDKVFTYKKQYQLHCSTHRMQKGDSGDHIIASKMNLPFTCPVCNIVIKSACNIKRHLDIHKEKQCSCNVCGKRFARSDHLKDHMKIHTGARPSICELCGKGCLNSSDLNRHLRIHTGSKPYVCPVCERGFTQKCTLDKHVLRHEKKPNAPKLNKSNLTTKPLAGPAQYTYKQMMKDLGKNPEKIRAQPVVKIEISTVEEKNVHDVKDSKLAHNSSRIPSQNPNPKTAKSSKPKSPAQAIRPQLFSLLTDAKTLAPPVVLPGKGKQVVPSVQTAAHSGGQNTQHMQMVQTEDGSTHIILPDSMEVGQEILVFVDKGADSNAQQSVVQESEVQQSVTLVSSANSDVQQSVVQVSSADSETQQSVVQEAQIQQSVTQESEEQQSVAQEAVKS